MKRLILGTAILVWGTVTVPLSGPASTPGHPDSLPAAGASLIGLVTDSQGLPLDGATVTAMLDFGRPGQKEFKTTSDKNGAFEIKNLPPGLYVVKAEWRGKIVFVRRDVRLEEGRPFRLDIKTSLVDNIPIVMEERDAAAMPATPPRGGVVGGVMGGVTAVPRKAAYHGAPEFNTEEYGRITDNVYLDALNNPLSTFSIDVDTASYANIRRFLKLNQWPPKDAVRVEEMVNYFDYAYPQPRGEHPFAVVTEVSAAPWNPGHKLVHIGLQGKILETIPPSNLVFLLDVSGSMNSPEKLPLLKAAFKLLVRELAPEDRISIVVYAGAAGLVLPATPGSKKDLILEAIDKLQAGGSTAGGAGIQLAYKTAQENFLKNGNNRIILATDGDFNVGVSSTGDLVRMIEEKRDQGIYLTVLGFGMGNTKDNRMEQLADRGNGNYYYVDGLLEAKKVFVNDLRGTLFTIAKDVKIQVEFNPAKVKAYRLIGYETRLLAKEDFADDVKDAGELGAGHTVTALYEIVPYGSKEEVRGLDPLKYQETKISPEAFRSKEMLTVKLRYKDPGGTVSKLIEQPLVDAAAALEKTSDDFRFAAAVAAFGMVLRDSEFKGKADLGEVLELAKEARGKDAFGYRAEFINLVEIASLVRDLQKSTPLLGRGIVPALRPRGRLPLGTLYERLPGSRPGAYRRS
jgi:Ca-activated chloride channel family protein